MSYACACLEDPIDSLYVESLEPVDVDHVAIQQDKAIPHRLRQEGRGMGGVGRVGGGEGRWRGRKGCKEGREGEVVSRPDPWM